MVVVVGVVVYQMIPLFLLIAVSILVFSVMWVREFGSMAW